MLAAAVAIACAATAGCGSWGCADGGAPANMDPSVTAVRHPATMPMSYKGHAGCKSTKVMKDY